jgi:glutamate dehydrogenase
VGIGDMSGDVFGNGMLLSRHIKLVAAFDHRHVFVDPHPDPERSWRERRRLFQLPRSSWADYDRSLISRGGGVFPRTAKAISLTDEMREVLGIGLRQATLSPAELISACLKAPVDLLWNGGIGTYVKASTQSHSDVGDKANDAVRVNGSDLQARCVVEGGNLGLTQLGRIEYARCGGRINTDFIDNSAGVGTSDHEVNIKILLAGEVASGRLEREARDALLASMTDEVAELVLAHDVDQNLALANAVRQAAQLAHAHEDWIEQLEEYGVLDRWIEYLPGPDELETRRANRQGLTSPELATLLAYTKIFLADRVLASSLPDDPYLTDVLASYFPTPLRERYADQMRQHRLRREIVTTVTVNRFVDTAGISCFHRLSIETGAGPDDIMRAHAAARVIFDADRLDREIGALDHQVDAETQTTLRLEVRTLVERATRWLVMHRRRPVDIGSAVEAFRAGVGHVQRELPDLLSGRDQEALQARREQYLAAGVPEPLAVTIAVLPPAYAGFTIVQTASRIGLPVDRVAAVHLTLSQRLGLDRLLARIIELPREDRWQTMARAALRDDLHAVHARLTATVLESTGSDQSEEPEALVERWAARLPAVGESIKTLRSLTTGRAELAKMSVALRVVRRLLPTPD